MPDQHISEIDRMTDAKFGAWTVPQSPVDIEYSMIVLDEIRQAVAEGFQRLSRGGIEVGGILYGTVAGRQIRIMSMREIACEHARGPTFHLSENDRALLKAQLDRERDDPRLAGMVVVGWYLSHTRSEILLQPSDLDTYMTFFPEPWQVTMVVRPTRANAMAAGFFVREPDGTVKADHSYQDFPFPDRPAGIMHRPPRERSVIADPRTPPALEPVRMNMPAEPAELSPRLASALERPPRSAPEFTRAPSAGYPAPKRGLPWTVIAVVVVGLVLAIIGVRTFLPRLNADPLGLAVSERDGQLRIQWNRASRSVENATSASMEIIDGPNAADSQIVNLTMAQLASGSVTYARKTADVQIRMTVKGPDGSVQEGSRYLGSSLDGPTTPEAVPVPTKAEEEQSQGEITRLREQNAQQAERIRQLERTMTILRNRLGIVDSSQ